MLITLKIMKSYVFLVLTVFVGITASCTSPTPCGCVSPVPQSDASLIGIWKLVRVTYGLTQKTATPTELGYDETIEFRANGMFQKLKLGNDPNMGNQIRIEETGTFSTGANTSQTAEKQAVFYSQDKTMQPYRIESVKLFLYERGAQGATIADGSTYEYVKQ